MDRRKFTQAIAAAALGIRGCREPVLATPTPAPRVPWPAAPVTDEQLADSAGGYIVPPEFVRHTITEAQGRELIQVVSRADRWQTAAEVPDA